MNHHQAGHQDMKSAQSFGCHDIGLSADYVTFNQSDQCIGVYIVLLIGYMFSWLVEVLGS